MVVLTLGFMRAGSESGVSSSSEDGAPCSSCAWEAESREILLLSLSLSLLSSLDMSSASATAPIAVSVNPFGALPPPAWTVPRGRLVNGLKLAFLALTGLAEFIDELDVDGFARFDVISSLCDISGVELLLFEVCFALKLEFCD